MYSFPGQKISAWHIQKTIEKYGLYYNPIKNQKLRRKRKLSGKKKRITELKNKKIDGFFFQVDTISIFWEGLKRSIFTATNRISKLAFARAMGWKKCRLCTLLIHKFDRWIFL